MSKNPLKPDSVILFQGDSITDTGRSRWSTGPNNPDGLGYGYARLIADRLLAEYSDHLLQIYNRGVSGDRVLDLVYRWDQDCLRLEPDLVSIMIGVNDTWNYVELGLGSSPKEYLRIFQGLLTDTIRQLPDVQFILCEPFLLQVGDVRDEWMIDIQQRQDAVHALASEFDAVVVPFQETLEKAAAEMPPSDLLDDGVHPTEKGHQVLAECWIKTVLQ
jgi:lysophospholipase L1-like esterase